MIRRGSVFLNRPDRIAYQFLMAIVLVLAIAWPLLSSALFRGVYLTESGGLDREVARFDSFSDGSVAVAILQREGQRFLADYVRARDSRSDAAPQERMAPSSGRAYLGSSNVFDARGAEPTLEMATAVKGLEELAGTVSELGNELDQALLVMHADNNSPDKLLDCYLDLLHHGPDHLRIVWGWQALEDSRRCARTEEVLDAIQHTIRFRPELKSRPALQVLLTNWVVQCESAGRAEQP